MRKLVPFAALAAISLCLMGWVVYQIPFVHSRLAWQLQNVQAQIHYALNPPQEVVFVPQQAQLEAIVDATLQALAETPAAPPIPTPTATPTQPGATPSPAASATPSPSPTAIPAQVTLTGIRHEYQQMNNCGPATLAMALSFWGWQGDQRDTRRYLRPNFTTVDDKNVNPAEMVEYVEKFTGLKALLRVGGDIELLKRLIAAGFPVIIEKGFQPPKEDWMGHYNVLSGYDESSRRFIVQDSYIMADLPLPYEQLSERWWRDFNYVYLAIYPPERESELLAILGLDADPAYNALHAAQLAAQETETLSGRNLYFAWFNLGTNRLALGDYEAAAAAYDQAFALYARLPAAERPWRMLWYQSGPYEAYYRTGRFQDVVSLANATLSMLSKPGLEETFFWRGLAREQLGDLQGAVTDLLKSVELNTNFAAGRQELERLGVEAP